MAITKFVPQMWSAALLVRFAQAEVIAPTVNRSYEGEVRQGNSVHIASITTPTVSDYSATRSIDPETLTDTEVLLSIDQEKAFSFFVDDVDRVQSAGSFEPVTADAAAALVEDSESYIAAQMLADGTNGDPKPGGVATASLADGDAAFDMVNSLRTALSKAKVPAAGRYLLVNPDYSALLLGAASKLTSANTAGSPDGLRMATIGQLLGFTVVESALLGTAGKACAVAYHQSAVAYANQIDKIEALRAQNKFADIVRSLHVYGAKVIRPTAVQYWQAA